MYHKQGKSEQYLMALDAGTGSVRAVIFNLSGQQISFGQKEWQHITLEGIPGSMDFDLNNNWKLTCQCIRKALNQANISPRNILSISCTSMREGIVVYDEQGEALWGCANVDARASQQVEMIKQKYPNFEQNMYSLTGQTLALSAIPRLMWLSQYQPDLFKSIHYMTMISDWIAAKLTNKLAVDPSNAGTSGLLDLKYRQWTPELLSQLGISKSFYPNVKETGTMLGHVTSKAAQESGLLEGTPVIMGGGDVQLGCLGLGLVTPSQAAVLGGTFWQQVVNLPHPITDPSMHVRINPHVIPGMAQAEAISFFTGLVMRWFRDAFCEYEKVTAKALNIDPYTLLEQMAQHVPVGSHGIIPIFSDVMKFSKWYHAAPSFINLSINPEHSNKASMFRALQENAAIVSALNLEQVAAFSNISLTEIVFAGGGAKGKLWGQILSDVTGLSVKVPKVKEATALGCAIAAGVGVGVYESFESSGQQLVKWDTTYTPNMENHKKYQDIKEKWLNIYQEQIKLVDKGWVNSLWKAPGL